MEKQQQIQLVGQEVQQQDVNTLGETAGLADDRVLAELFRMTPYDGSTVSKGILRYNPLPTVTPSGADGSIIVNPFRALIGSRTAEATEARKNWRDIRSGLSVAEGATDLQQTFVLTANASGSTRWDLVYAAVTPDADGNSVTRKQKDTTTSVVSVQTVATYKVTNVTVAVQDGTPGSGFPTITADGSGIYYIPLAFIRVPTGFGASSTVANKDVNDQAPCLSIAAAAGGFSIRPSTSNSRNGAAGTAGAGTTTNNGPAGWTGTSGVRPAAYIPPGMSGGESIMIAVDLQNASTANWSHQNGDVIDDSRDWRSRIFRWFASVGNSSGGGCPFPWISIPGGTARPQLSPVSYSGGINTTFTAGYCPAGGIPSWASGVGFSAYNGTLELPIAGVYATSTGGLSATPNVSANMPTNSMVSGTNVYLYVDHTTGYMKLGVLGSPLVSVFFWLDASAQYPNF